MPHCLIEDTRTYSFDNNLDNAKAHHPNHGLLALPAENLNHVCAYLNPISLYILSRTCSHLYALVKDDHVWKTAFLANFLGIAPENDDDDTKMMFLRRSELTWKKEYIARDSMLWRWERSRNSVVTHIPVLSVISATHLLASNGLLTSSLTNGIVARSNPVTGTITRGYLSSSAAGNGLGVGNHNAEFSLDVTACSINSDGGTAKIAWGFTNGRVAAMTVSKVMDAATKSAGKLVNSLVQDQHHGAVADLIWDGRANCILSASTEGTVKMWDPKSMLCLSTWGDRQNIDVYTKVISALSSGIFAVALLSGDIVVWTNIERDDAGKVVSNGTLRKISCPFELPSTVGSSSPIISGIHIHVTVASTSLLVTYQDHPHFYRVNITAESEEIIRFGDSSLGSIGCVCPSFASKPEDASFVVVGDAMGWVHIFPWTSGATSPVRKFEADTDGFGVTSLAINSMSLAVGTQNGTVNVFDSMTLRRVRPVFRALEPRRGAPFPVTSVNLSAGKDVLVASAGDVVMAWEAGHVKHPGRWGVRGRNLNGKKRAKGVTNAKGYAQIELKRTINESMAVLKYEKEARDRAMSRERKQRANFEELGLSDAEALEYVLMVSREEAQRAEDMGSSSASGTPEGSPPQAPSVSQEMREDEELRLAIELSLRD